MVTFARRTHLTRKPRVSVVVPCYNYGHHLPQLLDGVLNQPGIEVDVLIVDDASPDGSGARAQELAANDSRVKVMRHDSNKGHIQTYNDGLSVATGEYVVLLSADDLLPLGALTRAVELLEARPDVGFVYGYARSFVGSPPAVDPNVRNWSIWKGADWLDVTARRGRCLVVSPEVVMRRRALEQSGLYDARLPHSGDFDMWMRTALNWNVGRVNGPIQALYRVHESNMHLTTYAGMLVDLRERRLTFEYLFEEHAPDRLDLTALRVKAMRALSREAVILALGEHRASRQQSDPAGQYLQFAVETYPPVTSTLLWKRSEFEILGDRQIPGANIRRFASKVAKHGRWRWERRYGT